MGLLRVTKYINYLVFSLHRRGHGIHSPFVFDLVSRIFRNKIEPDIVFNIERIRKRLLQDQRSITVNDLGAGSKKMKGNLRTISEIAKNSSVPMKYGILLYNMARSFGSPVIVELGTSLGISTMYLAAASGETNVISMEGCKETSEIAAANFKEAGFLNIHLVNGSFDDTLAEIEKEKVSPGLVFIDGDHRKEHLIKYFNKVAGLCGNNSVVIVDDINLSGEMADAWTEIKNHEKVTLSVDLFRLGMIFFRKGLNGLSYKIRY